jgi:hypothetical protein
MNPAGSQDVSGLERIEAAASVPSAAVQEVVPHEDRATSIDGICMPARNHAVGTRTAPFVAAATAAGHPLRAAGRSPAVTLAGAPTTPASPLKPLTPPLPLPPPAPTAPSGGNAGPGSSSWHGSGGHVDGQLAVLASHDEVMFSLTSTRMASAARHCLVSRAGDTRGRPD